MFFLQTNNEKSKDVQGESWILLKHSEEPVKIGHNIPNCNYLNFSYSEAEKLERRTFRPVLQVFVSRYELCTVLSRDRGRSHEKRCA